ncbi:MAG: alkaline phosphatase family protein [bacterium]
MRSAGKRSASGVDRVVIVGFDGMDPRLVAEGMEKGELPNFARLKDSGCFHPLQTTFPAISPVAWSTFSTGVNPARHNIYDFLTRDRASYFPILSSSEIGRPRLVLNIGRYSFPLSKPKIENLRKGKTFWKILGENGIFSAVAYVPITFPPEKFGGLMISGMCLPDLKGSQGTFLYYTSEEADGEFTGGERYRVKVENGKIRSTLVGPTNPLLKKPEQLSVPFTISLAADSGGAVLEIKGRKITLEKGKYTDWVKVEFNAGFGIKVSGICRFLLRETEPEFKLYVTPINIDPEKPALPVTHPLIYSIYLAKKLGAYATLGLPEDSWGLNEQVIAPEDFIAQTKTVLEEREKQLHLMLDRVRRGCVAVVFDTTDALQHMFWRRPDRDGGGAYDGILRELYRDMDGVLGRVMEKTNEKTVLIVMSDHGFASFRRGVNLNTWLMKNGYLALNEGNTTERDFFQDVDWSKTRAFAVGLGGIFLNMKGREAKGTVVPSEAGPLKKEISEKLLELKDDGTGRAAVRNVYDTAEIHHGPYRENAPDLLVGYEDGYRASWESVTGKVMKDVFSDNERHWCGDHCIDPPLVPGIFFCNRKIEREKPRIMDIAPSVLNLFGVPIPDIMNGRNLFSDE